MPQELVSFSIAGLRQKVQKTLFSPVASVFINRLPNRFYLGHIPQLSIALTRICNADCVFCSYQFLERDQRKHMTEDVFQRVVEGLRRYRIHSVQLSPNLGEPTLSPNFIRRVRAIRAAGVRRIDVTTNATFLHKVGIPDFLDDAGPDVIKISFPGFNKAMYERVFRYKDYPRVRENILQLLRLNAKRRKPKSIYMLLRGDIPMEEQMRFPEMIEARGLVTAVATMVEVDSWNGKITQEMLTGNLKLVSHPPVIQNRPCQLLRELTVYPDGSLHGCSCRNTDLDPDLSLGNLLEDDLMQAYQRLNPVYDRWKQGQFPKICQACNMYTDPAYGFMGHLRQRAEHMFSR